jgi:hypothetical protein
MKTAFVLFVSLKCHIPGSYRGTRIATPMFDRLARHTGL